MPFESEETAAFVGASEPSVLWKRRLKVSSKNNVLGTLENVATALRCDRLWAESLSIDEFKQQLYLKRATPWNPEINRPINEADIIHITEWMQQQGVPAKRDIVQDAVTMVASEHAVHPVRDYFATLKWDGTARIDTWLTYFLGSDDTPFNRAVGAKWLISAIARIKRPGCKVDCMLILEGPQGTYKSTAFRVLAGPWFADEVDDLGSKDAAQQLRGVWILELSELDAMTRSEANRTKAWVSRSVDHYRPPYGRITVDYPRQCVFAGTCNRTDYLRDDTGGRRFWPVRIGSIDIDALRTERDQLWAEALARHDAGEKWWIFEDDLLAVAEDIQEERREDEPWAKTILDWLEDRPSMVETTTDQVLIDCIGMPKDRWRRSDQMRIGIVLSQAGWARIRARRSGILTWIYRKG